MSSQSIPGAVLDAGEAGQGSGTGAFTVTTFRSLPWGRLQNIVRTISGGLTFTGGFFPVYFK